MFGRKKKVILLATDEEGTITKHDAEWRSLVKVEKTSVEEPYWKKRDRLVGEDMPFTSPEDSAAYIRSLLDF